MCPQCLNFRHDSCRAGPWLPPGTSRKVLAQDGTGIIPGSDALRKEPCLGPGSAQIPWDPNLCHQFPGECMDNTEPSKTRLQGLISCCSWLGLLG